MTSASPVEHDQAGLGGPGPLRTRPSTERGHRVAFLLLLVLLAMVVVVAARSEAVVDDVRIGRRVELVELIRAEGARNRALQERVDELAARLAVYERDPPGDPVVTQALQRQIDAVAAAAGMVRVRGPGLEVTLTDSVLRTSPSGDLNDLVIHEQDLQAVINALWAGGAEAMTVNGQRILATTAIRCVGNTLLLHGAVYSPPYVIQAVGDPVGLQSALERDPAVERFAGAVRDFQVGFEVAESGELDLPAFEGVTALQVARPAGASS